MEREQVVFVAKLVAYLLIITGITILFAAIMYLVTRFRWLAFVCWSHSWSINARHWSGTKKYDQKIKTGY